ncbi:KMT2B methyltransferase, partial [Melanocharis versteri]|nr:KMT2B methyltransferase [Melanocharis versteri]
RVSSSAIHGRGLFCKRNIEAGEMVIEYSGIVVRSVLTDKREKFYDSKGIGCYMFRIDEAEVVDATMHGSAARFINHSCEPNCYSRVIHVEGHKRIVIFALRRILRGEELTYDYKFPIEEPAAKLPCNCGARRCRRFLN